MTSPSGENLCEMRKVKGHALTHHFEGRAIHGHKKRGRSNIKRRHEGGGGHHVVVRTTLGVDRDG